MLVAQIQKYKKDADTIEDLYLGLYDQQHIIIVACSYALTILLILNAVISVDVNHYCYIDTCFHRLLLLFLILFNFITK